MIIRWVRRKGEMQEAASITGVYTNKGEDNLLAGGMFKPAGLTIDLIRRLAGSQLFFLLIVQMFEPDSWVRGALRTSWALLKRAEVTLDLTDQTQDRLE